MENIEAELENKSIERVDPEPSDEPKKRTKKERSPAQIAAFEKARKKRAENLALKKQNKIKEPEKENFIDNLVDEEPPPRKPIKTQSTRKQALKSVDEYHDYPQKQPIINNYYYGTNNHDHQEVKQKKSRKKKVQIVESSSEDDSDEDYSPPPARPKKQIQRKQTPIKEPVEDPTPEPPRLRFNFV